MQNVKDLEVSHSSVARTLVAKFRGLGFVSLVTTAINKKKFYFYP